MLVRTDVERLLSGSRVVCISLANRLLVDGAVTYRCCVSRPHRSLVMLLHVSAVFSHRTTTAIPDRAGLLRIVRVIKSGIGCWVEGWCRAQWSGGRCPFSLPASAKAPYATTWSQLFAWATPPLLRKRGNLTPSHATYVTQRAGPTLCRCHITYFDAYKF